MIRPSYLRDDENDCQCVASGLSERHDEMYECKKCGKCCGDEVTLAESNDSYEDKGKCIPCCLEEGVPLEEIAIIVGRTY